MASTHEFEGWIDEVAIFARGLSADEVAAMFQAGNSDSPRIGKGGD